MSRLAILDQPSRGPAAPAPVPFRPRRRPDTRLIDSFGRRLTYLRVSVTDRCNLRCTYCLPEDADFPFGDRDFLSPDEIETIVGALVRLGIRRVRLTGGEPLVRRDLLEIVRRVKALPGLENLALSTNGTELARLAPALKEAGVDRVNVSVDSLDPERFREITRRGDLEEVWRGSRGGARGRARTGQAQRRAPAGSNRGGRRAAGGPHPRPAAPRPLHRDDAHRRQPSPAAGASSSPRTTSAPAWRRASDRSRPTEAGPRTGPAKAYRSAGAAGTVGFITPLSHTFCAECNRLRLTARGELRLCLFADRIYPLRHLLAAPDPAAALEDEILRVLQEKPAEHMLTQGNYGNLVSFMQIGG